MNKPGRRALRRLVILASIAICLSGLAGCIAIDDDALEIDSAGQAIFSENALTLNALTLNALTLNALTLNALTLNGLVSASPDPGVFNLDVTAAGDLHRTAAGRQLLRYLVRCAYRDSEVLVVPSYPEAGFGEEYYPGLLGLRTATQDQQLEVTQQEMMSSCLLAHLNKFGVSVDLSVRYGGASPVTYYESEHYYVGDGVFYGNVFTAPQKRYACTIRQRPDHPFPTEATGPHLADRVCDENLQCGVINTGYCDEVCTSIRVDGKQWAYSSCHDGQPVESRRYYADTFSVWLEGTSAQRCQGFHRMLDLGFTCKP